MLPTRFQKAYGPDGVYGDADLEPAVALLVERWPALDAAEVREDILGRVMVVHDGVDGPDGVHEPGDEWCFICASAATAT